MPDRREALKIIGAIGSTCAFPFSSDELYGQHVHPPAGASAEFGPPQFFTPAEMTLLARITDLLIPETDTPGAVQAGVPGYIDFVVNSNQRWRSLFRQQLLWLDQQSFTTWPEQRQTELLARYIDLPGGDDPHILFFRAVKGMTADGYYTSRIGLMEELAYKGNAVRESYPACEIPEH